MRKLILANSITLDGFVGGPAGELDWVAMDADIDAGLPSLIARCDAAVLGRNLFEGFFGYWPKAHEINPNLSEGERAFQDWINAAPKYILSRSWTQAEWNGQVLKGDLTEAIQALKAQPGKDLLSFGGASTGAALLAAGLVDELSLMINPISLGKGLSLYADIADRQRFRIASVKAYGDKVVNLMLEKA